MFTIGIFKGIAREVVICRASTGTDYIGVVLESVDGPTKGDRIPASLYCSESKKEHTRAALAAMGWQGEVDGDCNLIGCTKPVDFCVVEEEYKGRKSLKVDWVHESPFGNGINAKDRQRMSPTVAGLIANLGGKAPAMANGGGAARRGPPPGEWNGEGTNPDDIPFASCSMSDDLRRWGL